MNTMNNLKEEAKLLPHHEQLPLCTTRLPYRQGRKLTAVKVYTVNDESAHLLIFGVPSLNLRREAKELFIKFGQLIKFNVMKDYKAEDFTETYHAYYDKIQSARIAKKMLDTKSFYGSLLHLCYAPELETIEETRHKLMQRKKDVLFRLRNLQRDANKAESVEKNCGNVNMNINEGNMNDNEANSNYQAIVSGPVLKQNVLIGPILDKETAFERTEIVNEIKTVYEDCENRNSNTKLNMGESNVIYLNRNKRRFKTDKATEKGFKSNKKSKLTNQYGQTYDISNNIERPSTSSGRRKYIGKDSDLSNEEITIEKDTDIVDCTSTEIEVVSNINEALNYNKFGNETIRKIEMKPLNKIVFNVNKKIL